MRFSLQKLCVLTFNFQCISKVIYYSLGGRTDIHSFCHVFIQLLRHHCWHSNEGTSWKGDIHTIMPALSPNPSSSSAFCYHTPLAGADASSRGWVPDNCMGSCMGFPAPGFSLTQICNAVGVWKVNQQIEEICQSLCQ